MTLKTSVVLKAPAPEPAYPRLMQRLTDGLVVLFTARGIGTVVHAGDCTGASVGYYSKQFDGPGIPGGGCTDTWKEVRSVTITTEN